MKRAGAAAARLCGAALAVALAAGCQRSAGGITGAVSGTTVAALTANPALGAAVGLGTQAATDAAVRYGARRWHRTEQDALAAAVGGMAVGEVRPWRVERGLPVGRTQGEVRVIGLTETPLTACKEVLFSVAEGGGDARWFLTSACRHEAGWKWAAAEPATGRWGYLQ